MIAVAVGVTLVNGDKNIAVLMSEVNDISAVRLYRIYRRM